MSKSLEQKLAEKIKVIIKGLEEQKIVVTSSKILEELRQLKEYKKAPESTMTRNINNILNKMEIEEKLKKKSLNNSLPYINKKQKSSGSRTHFDEDDEINKEIADEIKKKVKGDDSNNIDIENIVSIEQLGGISTYLEQIQEHIYLPLKNQDIFQMLNVTPPKGLLLTGPAGSGKTALGLAICKDIFIKFSVPFFFKPSTEIIGGISGESEKNLRKLFKEATQAAPSIIFIDEIDAIAGSRDKASKEMERRVVSELLSSLDRLPSNVFVVASTSRPENLEQAIRRGGRFDNEIILNVPDDEQREDILMKLTQKNPIGQDVDIKELSKRTPGYVPADLNALVRKAGVTAVQRIIQDRQSKKLFQDQQENNENNKIEEEEQQQQKKEVENDQKKDLLNEQEVKIQEEEQKQLQQQQEENGKEQQQENKENEQKPKNPVYFINQPDFEVALKTVQPTGKREGFTSIPDVTWDDIGGLNVLKKDLYNNIILPIVNPEQFKKFGINSPAGVLLYGPPGCGKTLIAKAVANTGRANFIAVKGPELLNKYVGESEKGVRSLFARARQSSPCIIFFDELDALVPRRGTDGNQVTERVVNTLLAELDGVESRKQVFIVGATNRPDIIDPAMLRGGRLDKLFYVPLPDEEDKLQILKAQTRKMPLDDDIDFTKISHSKRSTNYSGADLASMVKEAGLLAILSNKEKISQAELEESFKKSLPSLSESDRISYEKLQKKLRSSKKNKEIKEYEKNLEEGENIQQKEQENKESEQKKEVENRIDQEENKQNIDKKE